MAKPSPLRYHTHDRLVRLYFGDPALFAEFLLHFGDQSLVPLLNLSTLRPEDPAGISGNLSQRIGDLRYRCVFKGSEQPVEVFVFFEHQSTPQYHTSLRILRNIADAYLGIIKAGGNGKPLRPLPYPLAIILYHGKMPWRGPLKVQDFVGPYSVP